MSGTKVIHADEFKNHEGENVNRLVLDVNGHNVQVIQYDKNPSVLVFVDTTAKIMDISKAEKFIASRTGKG